MGFGSFGMTEMLVVAAIAALLFGPRQLPKLGRSVGDAIREFRNAGRELTKGASDDDEDTRDRWR